MTPATVATRGFDYIARSVLHTADYAVGWAIIILGGALIAAVVLCLLAVCLAVWLVEVVVKLAVFLACTVYLVLEFLALCAADTWRRVWP